ncbi:uncharacterized protein TrAtP1_003894 [Trichoderma atroviride]|uniref:uncharacterized protein n=1 Tax=Hypocrea atroviridis TaxID=63577 RepID=UPI0033185104|nr:hypothetical protein TrAtP1_003894 [Trichoderma atroviride]
MWQRIDESVETRLEILAEGLEASFSIQKSSDILYRKLYPCIGHSGGEAVTVRVNFGEDRFKWREANSDK